MFALKSVAKRENDEDGCIVGVAGGIVCTYIIHHQTLFLTSVEESLQFDSDIALQILFNYVANVPALLCRLIPGLYQAYSFWNYSQGTDLNTREIQYNGVEIFTFSREKLLNIGIPRLLLGLRHGGLRYVAEQRS